MNKLATPEEVCDFLSIKKDKLYKMTSKKEIPFLKVGRELRFDIEEVRKAFVMDARMRRILL